MNKCRAGFATSFMQYDATRCVMCTSNNNEYIDRTKLQNVFQGSYNVNLSDLPNAIKKLLDEISCDRHFTILLPEKLCFKEVQKCLFYQ